jgi:hypothetical protein
MPVLAALGICLRFESIRTLSKALVKDTILQGEDCTPYASILTNLILPALGSRCLFLQAAPEGATFHTTNIRCSTEKDSAYIG